MPTDRAGYTVCVFAIDVSPSMGEVASDPDRPDEDGKGKKRTRLDLAKEYVARVLEPKISSGRKTEAVGILSFGGRTNNQANKAYATEHPEEEDPPYEHISSDVAIQTAKPKTVEEVMNLDVGTAQGNPISALMVALDMIHVHKHTKSWALEVVLVTDGESNFEQDEYEDCMARFESLGVKFTVVGYGFDIPPASVDKSKSRAKRLSEKFWRTFYRLLHEEVSKTTSSEELIPEYLALEPELSRARLPKPIAVNGTLSSIDLFIGSPDINPEEAIQIPVKYSKATMRARPPTLAKAWKPAMDLQAPLQPNARGQAGMSASGRLLTEYAADQSQDRTGSVPSQMGALAAMVTSEVKQYRSWVVKKPEPEPEPTQTGTQGSQRQPSQASKAPEVEVEEEEEEGREEMPAEEELEETVPQEDLVRAWRFGSTWVPMEKDTFEPLNTKKGVEVLGFFPRANLKRHHLMDEVRFVWPDISSPKGQIQFSSFVTALILREMVAVVRWVIKDQSEPVIGICIPEQDFPDAGKRLDFMFWIRDEHNFWFPSLETYKTSSGKVLKEHPLLPTEEQCDLMERFVKEMDLDEYAGSLRVKKEDGEEQEDADMEEQEDYAPPWFEALNSYNPAIHRIKEAIFHASLTYDLDADPLGPPHPELTKYFTSPEPLIKATEETVEKLKESLAVKKVPLKVRLAKRQKEGLREGEGYIDIDDLFDDDEKEETTAVAPHPTPKKGQSSSNADDGEMPPPPSAKKATPAKPKRGRLISNENPMADFTRLINGEGDVFRKAIQDLGAVVKENVEASFSRQAFPLAIECLEAMRETALTYEEADTYNAFLLEFEQFINAPEFKHKDFWKEFQKAGKKVAHITPEEEEAALNPDEDE